MAWARVQGNNIGATAQVGTVAVSFGVAVTSGNLVVGIVTWDSAGGITLTSVKDDKTNTYTISDTINDSTDTQSAASFFLGNITNGPTTITATFSSAASFRSLLITEYSGGSQVTDPRDGHSGRSQLTTSNPSTASITTTTNGDLIWGSTVNCSSGVTATAGTGFTIRESNTVSAPIYTEDETQATAGAVAASFTAGSANWTTFVIAFKPPGVAGVAFASQELFPAILGKKLSTEFTDFRTKVSPPVSPIFSPAALFDPSRSIKQPDRLQEDFGAPFLTPPPPLTSLFDTIKSRPQTIDNPPILFTPAAAVATFIVEQSFFDTIAPRRPTELTQGPFGETSPPISVAYFTQSLFDPTKLKQPSISIPDVTPREPFKFFGERWFEITQIKRTLVEAPPILLATKAVAANIVEQPFFDALPRIKLPERLSELYPQRFWAPQLYQSLFDPSIKLKVPAGGDWTPTGAVQINTLRYAISDWFAIVRPKQPLVETPLVDYFPFVASVTPAQYVLLVPHYINDGYYPAYTTVTEGVELPFGWPPTLAVEPLNTPAIQNYWNQGPKPMTDAQPYKEFFPFFQTYKRSVYWLPTGIPGQFQLTGNGAALGPRT